MFVLKTILAKMAKGVAVSAEELAFAKANKDVLTDEQNESVDAAEVESEESDDAEDDETVDEKGLHAVIKREIGKAVSKAVTDLSKTKDADEDDGETVENRAKSHVVASGRKTIKQVEADKETRDFVKALITRDHVSLKAMTTSTADTAKAGYTVPEVLETEIMRLVQDQYGIARREMRYMPMNGDGNKRLITVGGALSVFWTDEGGEKTSTQATLSRVTQELKKLAAIVPLTDELIEDSAINLTNYVAELFAEAIAKEEDDQFFNGDGTVWTGVLQNGNTNSVSLAATQKFATDITPAKLRAVLTATPNASRRNGKWFMNTGVFDVIAEMKDGSGNYIYPALQNGTSTRLMGKEVVLTDSLPDGSSVVVSDEILFFGDLSKAAVYGDKGGMRIKVSDEATIRNVADSADIHLFEQDMTAVRVVRRVGYVLALPSAITVLKNGAAT